MIPLLLWIGAGSMSSPVGREIRLGSSINLVEERFCEMRLEGGMVFQPLGQSAAAVASLFLPVNGEKCPAGQ
ncbi:hypothetical protein EB230_04650 [Mesorhizobium sp. NZP2234]|nr:hypothetical protein EB230_04650 [Mesorhizobium sp. NZP2234]